MLKLTSISKRFGGLSVLQDVNIEVPQGSIFGLIGPNGAGKTTVFNLITGLLAPTGGSLTFNDIALETALRPHGGERTTIARTNFRAMYWTMAQQLAHHAVSGCNVRVGDLMGSGTISGTTPDSYGSLLELTVNGKQPLDLGNGTTRAFLEDGDEVTMTGWCQGDGYRVGFGEVRGEILPARSVK